MMFKPTLIAASLLAFALAGSALVFSASAFALAAPTTYCFVGVTNTSSANTTLGAAPAYLSR